MKVWVKQLEIKVIKGLVSEETVVLRLWGTQTQKCGFINRIIKVNWPL